MTSNLEQRMEAHNLGLNTSTKSGKPWKLIYSTQVETKALALQLERKIKKRGAQRYLNDCEQ